MFLLEDTAKENLVLQPGRNNQMQAQFLAASWVMGIHGDYSLTAPIGGLLQQYDTQGFDVGGARCSSIFPDSFPAHSKISMQVNNVFSALAGSPAGGASHGPRRPNRPQTMGTRSEPDAHEDMWSLDHVCTLDMSRIR